METSEVGTAGWMASQQRGWFYLRHDVDTEPSTPILNYYTKSPEQQPEFRTLQYPEYLNGHPAFEDLVNKCLSPFDSTTDYRIKVFLDGNKPFSPTTPGRKDDFEAQARAVIAPFCADYLDQSVAVDEGGIKTDYQDKWNDLIEIAPEIIRILTSRNNLIELVHQEQAANVIATALQLARYPDTTLVLRIGFGGSQDAFTNFRLPAYILPAIKIATEIRVFYENRAKSQRSTAANPTKIQLFFAHEAAIAVNRMSPEAVRQRSSQNMQALMNYVNSYHPDLADQVEFMADIPWEQHNFQAQVLIEYLAHVLKTSPDPVVQEELKNLQKRGKNHGDEQGAQMAAEYAAIHPLVFGDRLNLPFLTYIRDGRGGNINQHPEINITIGGSTERHFDAVRQYLINTASPEGLIDFIIGKAELLTHNITQPEEIEEFAGLTRMATAVSRWESRVTHLRTQQYQSGKLRPSLVNPDYPRHMVMLITDLCAKAPYYNSTGDVPIYSVPDVDAYICSLEQQLQTTDPQNQRSQYDALKSNLRDVKAIQEDIGSFSG